MSDQSKIKYYEERLKKDANSKEFAPLADEYRKAGMIDKAIEKCKQGLKKHPNYQSAYVVLGRCYYDTKNFKSAKTEFENALKLDPRNAIALKFLGEIYFSEGNINKAKEYYEKIVEVDPFNEEIQNKLEEIKSKLKPEKSTQKKSQSSHEELNIGVNLDVSESLPKSQENTSLKSSELPDIQDKVPDISSSLKIDTFQHTEEQKTSPQTNLSSLDELEVFSSPPSTNNTLQSIQIDTDLIQSSTGESIQNLDINNIPSEIPSLEIDTNLINSESGINLESIESIPDLPSIELDTNLIGTEEKENLGGIETASDLPSIDLDSNVITTEGEVSLESIESIPDLPPVELDSNISVEGDVNLEGTEIASEPLSVESDSDLFLDENKRNNVELEQPLVELPSIELDSGTSESKSQETSDVLSVEQESQTIESGKEISTIDDEETITKTVFVKKKVPGSDKPVLVKRIIKTKKKKAEMPTEKVETISPKVESPPEVESPQVKSFSPEEFFDYILNKLPIDKNVSRDNPAKTLIDYLVRHLSTNLSTTVVDKISPIVKSEPIKSDKKEQFSQEIVDAITDKVAARVIDKLENKFLSLSASETKKSDELTSTIVDKIVNEVANKVETQIMDKVSEKIINEVVPKFQEKFEIIIKQIDERLNKFASELRESEGKSIVPPVEEKVVEVREAELELEPIETVEEGTATENIVDVVSEPVEIEPVVDEAMPLDYSEIQPIESVDKIEEVIPLETEELVQTDIVSDVEPVVEDSALEIADDSPIFAEPLDVVEEPVEDAVDVVEPIIEPVEDVIPLDATSSTTVDSDFFETMEVSETTPSRDKKSIISKKKTSTTPQEQKKEQPKKQEKDLDSFKDWLRGV